METLKEAFSSKYPSYSDRILSMYEKTNGEATWENITKPGLSKFVVSLQNKVAKSSARTYCAMFKAVLTLYSEEVDLPKGYGDILTLKKDVSQNVFLDDSEIQKIISYEPENDTERAVRNQFILGALTGARYSDYIMLTRENIFRDRLRYVSKKTHIQAEVPLAPAVKRIIKENEIYGFVGHEFSTTHFNTVIKEIAKKAGIREKIKLYQKGGYREGEKWEFVGSHTARRSFATNLYLLGVDLYAISKMCGHSSVTQTENYIMVSITQIPDNVIGYFDSFQ